MSSDVWTKLKIELDDLLYSSPLAVETKARDLLERGNAVESLVGAACWGSALRQLGRSNDAISALGALLQHRRCVGEVRADAIRRIAIVYCGLGMYRKSLQLSCEAIAKAEISGAGLVAGEAYGALALCEFKSSNIGTSTAAWNRALEHPLTEAGRQMAHLAIFYNRQVEQSFDLEAIQKALESAKDGPGSLIARWMHAECTAAQGNGRQAAFEFLSLSDEHEAAGRLEEATLATVLACCAHWSCGSISDARKIAARLAPMCLRIKNDLVVRVVQAAILRQDQELGGLLQAAEGGLRRIVRRPKPAGLTEFIR